MAYTKCYYAGLLVGSALLVSGLSAGQKPAVAQTASIVRYDFRLPENLPSYPVAGSPKVFSLRNGYAPVRLHEQQPRVSLLRLPARTLQTPPGVKIGSTSYDWQTNFLSKNRMVWVSGEGVLQLVWMAGSNSPDSGWPDRGTYYAAVDLSDPQNPQAIPTQRGWVRIEPRRTGWPAAAELPGGGVAFVSHTPLRLGKNGGALDENWTVTDIGPAGSLWPYMTSTPEGSLHVVYTYSGGNNAGQVGYLRSTDQGQTWSQEVFLSGGDAPQGIQGADHYAIEFGGGKLVAAYYAIPLQTGPGIVLRISTDNGQTWSQAIGLFPGQFQLTQYVDSTTVQESDTLRVTTTYFHTDTTTGVDGYSLLVDAQGRWHILATLAQYYLTGQITRRDTLPQGGTGIDTTYALAIAAVNPVAAYAVEGSQQPVLVPLPQPVLDATGQVVRVLHRAMDGYVDRIKLGMDDAGQLYAVFIAPAEGDTFSVDGVTYGYGHLYVTAEVNTQWTTPQNLSPNGIDCSFPTASKGGPAGYALVAYQAGTVPGSFVQGAVWEPGKDDDIYVYAHGLPVGVRETEVPGAVQLLVQPHPLTQSGYAQLRSVEAGWVTVELYTSIGAKLQTLYDGWLNAGETRLLWLNITELSSGVYYLKLRFNGNPFVRQIVVLR